MGNGVKVLIGIFVVFGVIIGLTFATGSFDVLYTKTIGKQKQDAKREVFEETQSYVHGKNQELYKLYLEYQKAPDPMEKAMLQEIIRGKFAEFDSDKIEEEFLRNFLIDMKTVE